MTFENTNNLGHIGRYRVIDRLAVGGMAEVLLAVDELGSGAQRTVVIKRILPHLADDRTFFRMFVQEARIAAGISHPNVVRIHKLGDQNGFPYIVMEFVAGCTFRQLLKEVESAQSRVPIGVALHLGIQACAGAHAAHEYINPWGSHQEIVHRDLSPHNLMVTGQGLVKVVDFGIAKASRSSDTTRTGVLKGKIGYLSPEQVLQRSVDRRSDIFTLCTVIWELLAGERLFEGQSDLEIMQAVSQCQLKALSAVRHDVPKALVQILEGSLVPEPKNRFATAADLAGALKSSAYAAGVSLSPRETSTFIHRILGERIQDLERCLEQSLTLNTSPQGDTIRHKDWVRTEAQIDTPKTSPTRVIGSHVTMIRPQRPSIPGLHDSTANTPLHFSLPDPDALLADDRRAGPPMELLVGFFAILVAAMLFVGWVKVTSVASTEAPPDETPAETATP
jgi:eukaryotic-like serine/threonine-protein kinase